MSHFDNLMAIVTANNNTYARITHDLHLFEDLDATSEAKRQETKRNHFAHEYANALDNYVIRNYNELKPSDFRIFDLVPYLVWNKISIKASHIATKIEEIHKGHKTV
jgi:hypothetical protein